MKALCASTRNSQPRSHAQASCNVTLGPTFRQQFLTASIQLTPSTSSFGARMLSLVNMLVLNEMEHSGDNVSLQWRGTTGGTLGLAPNLWADSRNVNRYRSRFAEFSVAP